MRSGVPYRTILSDASPRGRCRGSPVPRRMTSIRHPVPAVDRAHREAGTDGSLRPVACVLLIQPDVNARPKGAIRRLAVSDAESSTSLFCTVSSPTGRGRSGARLRSNRGGLKSPALTGVRVRIPVPA